MEHEEEARAVNNVLCIWRQNGLTHLIVGQPGTDLFIDFVELYQQFFEMLQDNEQIIFSRCVVDGLAAYHLTFLRLSQNNGWILIAPEEAQDITFSAFRCGLSNVHEIFMENQIFNVRTIQDQRPEAGDPAV